MLRKLRGIVLGSNALTPTAWNQLSYEAKHDYLAQSSALDVKAQASVLAVVGKREIRHVVNAWVALGLLPAERIADVLAAEPDHTRGGAR